MPLKLNRTLYTVNADLNTKASVNSPALEGTPTAPTPSVGDNSDKLATTAFVAGAAGNLLRITSFTSSGTWTKQADVSKVLVFCVGGGGGGASGGNGGTGGTTSFGAFCSADGGGGGVQTGGIGQINASAGSTGVGDLIIKGTTSGRAYQNDDSTANTDFIVSGTFGTSIFGGFGSGGFAGQVATNSARTGGGGAAASLKLLLSSSLTSTVSVTIGAGGAAGSASGQAASAGLSGIVVIYEYGY